MLDFKYEKVVLNQEEPYFLKASRKKVNGKITYVCPNCGNGSKKSGDGIVWVPNTGTENHYKCFVCGLHEDVIGLWMLHNNERSFSRAVYQLHDYFRLGLSSPTISFEKKTFTDNVESKRISADEEAKIKKYIQEHQSNTFRMDYLFDRGISLETETKYGVFYDPSLSVGYSTWKACVIPTSESSYVARNTDEDAEARYTKAGKSCLYLPHNLLVASEPVFIVEGEIDALSIIEAGGLAVGMGSIYNRNKLFLFLEEHNPKVPLILSLDRDDPGMQAEEEISERLLEIGINHIRYNLYGNETDANGALMASKEYFEEEIGKAKEKAMIATQMHAG